MKIEVRIHFLSLYMYFSLTDVCVSSCLLTRVCMSCMRDSNNISLQMFKAHEISEPQLHNENRKD